MAYTINLNDDFMSAEELQLRETKLSILKKLRARFGEYVNHDRWEGTHPTSVKEFSKKPDNLKR